MPQAITNEQCNVSICLVWEVYCLVLGAWFLFISDFCKDGFISV